MALCATGCKFFAGADGLCSACALLAEKGAPRVTPAQQEAQRREWADAGAARTLYNLDAARSHASRATVALAKRLARDAATAVATPRDLWTLLRGNACTDDLSAHTCALMLARDAAPLFALYEARPHLGWLYGHVIAAHVVDNWNLGTAGCTQNTLGYAGGDCTLAGAQDPGFSLASRASFVVSQLDQVDAAPRT
jgi:hypothetical protein